MTTTTTTDPLADALACVREAMSAARRGDVAAAGWWQERADEIKAAMQVTR